MLHNCHKLAVYLLIAGYILICTKSDLECSPELSKAKQDMQQFTYHKQPQAGHMLKNDKMQSKVIK